MKTSNAGTVASLVNFDVAKGSLVVIDGLSITTKADKLELIVSNVETAFKELSKSKDIAGLELLGSKSKDFLKEFSLKRKETFQDLNIAQKKFTTLETLLKNTNKEIVATTRMLKDAQEEEQYQKVEEKIRELFEDERKKYEFGEYVRMGIFFDDIVEMRKKHTLKKSGEARKATIEEVARLWQEEYSLIESEKLKDREIQEFAKKEFSIISLEDAKNSEFALTQIINNIDRDYPHSQKIELDLAMAKLDTVLDRLNHFQRLEEQERMEQQRKAEAQKEVHHLLGDVELNVLKMSEHEMNSLLSKLRKLYVLVEKDLKVEILPLANKIKEALGVKIEERKAKEERERLEAIKREEERKRKAIEKVRLEEQNKRREYEEMEAGLAELAYLSSSEEDVVEMIPPSENERFLSFSATEEQYKNILRFIEETLNQ